MQNAVILDGIRTPIGKHRGALASVRPDDLAAHVMLALIARNPSAGAALNEVIFGATNQAGEDNRNVARMAALLAGLPYEVPAVTVNRLCGSGLEAVIQASRQLRLGEADVMLAGGVESMTRAPYATPKAEEAFPRTPPQVFDTSLGWRFQNKKMEERFPLISMGETAENVAHEYKVSREDQDAFAVHSHSKASRAQKAGVFSDELAPVSIAGTIAGVKGVQASWVRDDESIRHDATLESMAKLKPVFKKDGSVTAGNSSPLNDGAAVVLLTTEAWAKANGQQPLARVVASASAGVHPNVMGIGPIPATQKVLERAGLKADQLDLIELNEAFAAQALACIRTLGLPSDRVNVNGGALALGHPIGCSGARIILTLAHEMKRRNARYGLATLCIGVGQGLAVVLQRP